MMESAELQRRIRAERTAALIINTVSRNGERLFVRALDGLARRGITVSAAYPVHHPDRLPEIVHSAVQHGHRLIVIGGGDGTVSAVVDYLAYQDVVLGLLPLGTGNSFANTLHIPFSLNGALDVIAQGDVARIDLGRIGDDYFANVAPWG